MHQTIQTLAPEVIAQIAAGEVIQRPVNAVKELLDNALDAGATQVAITVKDGGKKLLTIQDNGHGVQAEDLHLLCKRHATSKLQKYEDLTGISTLGFRGEALASISCMAHLSVVTRHTASAAGLKASYRNTALEAPGPVTCAAQPGTTFVIEDLYYNLEQRRKALGSAAEEYSRILDLVGKYAVSRPEVAFSCKKQGERRADLHTISGASRRDNVRAVYGAAAAQSLLPLVCRVPAEDESLSVSKDQETELSFSAEGFVSCLHFTGRRTISLIKINGHLVQCRPLEHSLEAFYHSHARLKPFVFLDIQLPGDQVDVNVHPTKHEVIMLHQEEITQALCDALQHLHSGQLQCSCSHAISARAGSAAAAPQKPNVGTGYRPESLVRTDRHTQKLHNFFMPSSQLPSSSSGPAIATPPGAGHREDGVAETKPADSSAVQQEVLPSAEGSGQDGHRESKRPRLLEENTGTLAAAAAREKLQLEAHSGLRQRLQHFVLVGQIDGQSMLVQEGLDLILVNTSALAHDLFYQLAVEGWGIFPSIVIANPVSIATLVSIALKDQVPKDKVAEAAAKAEACLLTHCQALEHGMRLGIDESNRTVTALPLLLPNYMPNQNGLPSLLAGLANILQQPGGAQDVEGIAEALAAFYAPKEVGETENQHWKDSNEAEQIVSAMFSSRITSIQHTMEHVLFPALRGRLIPRKKRAGDGTFTQLANLKMLYRVFERC
ncbi:g4891 [Coccomyxa viridis]|uniref:G4891 protein n=1 Tax=Coccomyxa viridis TaxID=1274662 RepID=A0ABP1FU11_9CHLO